MHRILGAILLGLMGLVTIAAQEPKQLDPEVLTRGPIHEAYASSVSIAPQPGLIAPKAPPEPIEELPPDEKPEGDVVWIPGYWNWDEERSDYIWISGFWRVPPPSRQWVPGTWRSAGTGFQWTSGFWAGAQEQQIEYVPPPPEPLESAASTPAPGENYLYAPGCWVYRETRYAWRPGFWYAYRPDWVYIPAHYVWSPCGYVFVDGYWDYPLQRRGVLFAPVYFTPGVYYRPGFRYRPNYVLYDQALYGCLFVRPGYNAYYFGDYFEARYTSAGYRSWFDVRIGVGSYDPLWGYYRTRYATTPGWSVGITNLYAGRYSGAVARPPRTFVQQTTVINNISNNTTTVINKTNISNVTLAAPINSVDKSQITLKPVSAAEQQAAMKSTRELRVATAERVKLENQAIARGRPATPGQPTGPVQPIKVNLPPTPIKNTVTPQPTAPTVKDPPNATTPGSKDRPKGTMPPPMPKDQPKGSTPAPKEQPKGTMPPPLPKEQPKGTTPQPKDQPKTPPPLPKEQPKATNPPPLPKGTTPQPKEQPKAPPPLPKEQPKSTNPPPQPKSPPPPPVPVPAPKGPPPPQPKNVPVPKNDAPKGKGKNDPPAQVNIAPPTNSAPRAITQPPAPPKASPPPPNAPAPRPMAPAPAPKASSPPPPPPRPVAPAPAPKANTPQRPPQNNPRPAERPKGGKDKSGDRPKQ